jgi:DNA-directed RNA polymerase subunit RPC12/RpoP
MGLRDTLSAFASRFTSKSYTETTTRPSIAQPYMSTDTGAKLPIFPFPLIMIYELADNIDALRIPIETLNREMFKNGFEVVEKWKYKCNNCGKEFQYQPLKGDHTDDQPFEQNQNNESNTIPRNEAKKAIAHEINPTGEMECDTCGSDDLLRPVPENRKKLEDMLEKPINGNEQTLEDLSRQLERDLEVADNAYCLVLKNYKIDDVSGRIDHDASEVKELLRIDPPQVALIADSDGRIGYDDKRNQIFVCPRFEHRDKRLTVPKCERCGSEALKAVLEVNSVYSIGIPQPKRVVYGEGEVIWKAGKYKPSLLYGYSPIYSIWSKAMSLSHMDEYIRKYFDKMRPPRGMLVIASRNYETFRKSWDTLEEKAIEDPYTIHPLLVESDKGSKNMAQWIDFTGSLKELEFTEIRRELRMIIGAVFGVLPLYFGELPSGWSQEGLQVTITNRAIKWGQDILYTSFFKKFAAMLDVSDWELRLKGGEENDKLRDLQIQGVEIQNMAAMQAMGFEVTKTHTGEFKVSKNPIINPTMMMLESNNESDKPNTSGSKGRGRGTAAPKEDQQEMDGKPKKQRPSDKGGVAQGSPSSGKGTSQSKKAEIQPYLQPKKFPDGITPANFEIVKSTLQSAIDFDWTKTKAVDELRNKAHMTVREAREIVKQELSDTKRWEEDGF